MALVLVVALAVPRSVAQSPAPATSAEELRAAKLVEMSLLARQASAEDLKKMGTVYAALTAKYPRDVAVLNAQAEFFWSMDERSRAMLTWGAAERLDPADPVVLDHLGGGFLALGETKRAAECYGRAVKSPRASASNHYNYANAAFLFRHELLDATHPDAESVLKEAQEHFAEASRMQPLDPEYARGYAETFYHMAQPDWPAALVAWQRVADISPKKDFALLNVARVQIRLGLKDQARESLLKIQSPDVSKLKNKLLERIDAQ